jgi:hypothetical protein
LPLAFPSFEQNARGLLFWGHSIVNALLLSGTLRFLLFGTDALGLEASAMVAFGWDIERSACE